MENCELTSHEMYNKLIKVFSELEEWTQKDIKEIKKYIQKSFTILEIGCSWGRVIKELAPYCRKFIGIDNSEIEIKEAKNFLKEIPNVELYLENGKKTHFPNKFFDIIIIVGNTFGNLGEDKEAVLQEMRKLLKKNGKIFLSVYIAGSRDKRMKAYQDIGMHVKANNKKIIFDKGLISEEFSEWGLKSLFKKEKLKVKFLKLNSIAIMCLIEKIKRRSIKTININEIKRD